MSANAKPRPSMSEELERCVAAAKALAAKEASKPQLDSLHLLIAAVRLAPQAAEAALRKAGHCWETVMESCPEVNATPAPELVSTQMQLTKELAEVIYERAINCTNGTGAPVDTGKCLVLLMQHPTARLRAFLRTIAGKAADLPDPVDKRVPQPYRSFREYLTDLREAWALRSLAWNEIQDAFFTRIGAPSRRRREGHAVEEMLERMLRKSDQSAQRTHASAAAAVPLLGIAAKHELSPVQLHLLEGLLVRELYVSADPGYMPATVRELAQLLSPEDYPVNFEGTVNAVQGLVKRELIEAIDCDGLSPHSHLRLTPCLLSDLLARLANDTINDDDVAMASRHLSACRSWPL